MKYETIIKSLTKIIEKLDAHEKASFDAVNINERAIDAMREENATSRREAEKSNACATKLRAIIG